MEMSTEASRAAAKEEGAATPPDSAKPRSALSAKSKPRTSYPFLIRLAAIGPPMLPSPIKAILSMLTIPQILEWMLPWRPKRGEVTLDPYVRYPVESSGLPFR